MRYCNALTETHQSSFIVVVLLCGNFVISTGIYAP